MGQSAQFFMQLKFPFSNKDRLHQNKDKPTTKCSKVKVSDPFKMAEIGKMTDIRTIKSRQT